MATVKTTSVQIKTDDLKGCGSVEFNTDTKLQESPIKMTWGGSTLSFSTVSDYHAFLVQVVLPLTDTLNSPSGAGNGFIAASAGVAGSDKITN